MLSHLKLVGIILSVVVSFASAEASPSAELYLFGGKDQPIDLEKAVKIAQEAADQGNPTAQALLGFMYATGTGVPHDEPTALLYYSFAAQAKEPSGLLALGYRYTHGRSVVQSCSIACKSYRILSEIAKQAEEADVMVAVEGEFMKLAEEVEWTSGMGYSEREVIQYYGFLADTGDLHALVTLGTLHLIGGFGLERNYQIAFDNFNMAAEFGEPAGYTGLGMLYEHGWGVPVEKSIAVSYYNMGVEAGDPGAMTRLGILYLRGTYVTKNYEKAIEYLDRAARLGEPEAHVFLGKIFKDGIGVAADVGKAVVYLAAAARRGLPIALHYLADLYFYNISGGCPTALNLYKKVAQYGSWGETIMWEAEDMFFEEEFQKALARYKFAAEIGYEVAQANAAWIYEHELDGVPVNYSQALKYYFMSAQQSATSGVASHIAIGEESYLAYSHVRIGDYYYYGLGVDPSYEIAAKFYQAAANKENPEALFNIGYMHHQGIGLPQDFPLAKRYYDMALEHHDTGLAVYPVLYLLWAEMIMDASIQFFRSSSASLLFASADSVLLLSMLSLLVLLLTLRIGLGRVLRQGRQPQQPMAAIPNMQ